MLPASLLKSLLSHTWTEEEEGGAEAEAQSTAKGWGASFEKCGGILRVGSSASDDGPALEQIGPPREGGEGVDEMRAKVLKLCDSLVSREVLNVAPIAWNGEFGEEEEQALNRAGFLIDQYEVRSPSIKPQKKAY